MLLILVSICITWACVFITLAIIGSAFSLDHNVIKFNIRKWISSFWIGWALLIAFLQIWHIFFPVNGYTFLLIGTISLLCLVTQYKFIAREIRSSIKNWFWLIPISVFSLWLSNRALAPHYQFDMGSYHLQQIKWISSYSIIFGLGNLYGRLAYNFSSLLYNAFLDIGPWNNKSHLISNGLLIFVACLQLSTSLVKGLFHRNILKPFELFEIFMIVPIIHIIFEYTSNLSPDLPADILGIVVSSQFLQFLYSHDEPSNDHSLLFSICLLSAAAIATRVTFLFMGGAVILIAMIKSYLRNEYSRKIWIVRSIKILSIPALVLITWMIRGVILSGYIIYPFRYLSFPVFWKVPEEQVIHEMSWNASWARLPVPGTDYENVLSNWYWFPNWFERISKESLLIIAPLILLLIGNVIYLYNWRVNRKYFIDDIFFFLPSTIALIAWFFIAPDIRFFASTALWIMSAGSLSISLLRLKNPLRILFLIRIYCIWSAVILGIYLNSNSILISPGPDRGYYPFPAIDYNRYTTNSGLVINTPVSGELCWMINLPCAPYHTISDPLSPVLHLLEPGNLSSGFSRSP